MPRPTEYHNRHIFTTSAEKAVYDEFYRITRRDGKTVSSLIQDFMEGYIKAHGEGNATFKLDNWTNNIGFKAMPTLTANEKIWLDYVKDCTDQELTDISIAANTRLKEIRFVRLNRNKK